MKLIRFNTAISGYGSPDRKQGPTFSFAEGSTAEVETELANAWIASGIANLEVVKRAAPEVAVVPTPENAAVPSGKPRKATQEAAKVPEVTKEESAN